MDPYPVGKLPVEIMEALLAACKSEDPEVVQGPGIGLDCAVLDLGEKLLVLKSDPITFTVDLIGWYAVHVNANDVATSGARPRWFTAALLLPQGRTSYGLLEAILRQVREACHAVGAELVGGHTEVTYGLERPIVSGTMLGLVKRDDLITPRGARAGDRVLLTKGVPIEATSILAREFEGLLGELPDQLIARAKDYIHHPGISVVPEALAAAATGGVTGMHDPTEGGLYAALWEFAYASGKGFEIAFDRVYISDDSARICDRLDVNPLEAISSGSLLLTVSKDKCEDVIKAIEETGVRVDEIGQVVEGRGVWAVREGDRAAIKQPSRDALARLFER